VNKNINLRDKPVAQEVSKTKRRQAVKNLSNLDAVDGGREVRLEEGNGLEGELKKFVPTPNRSMRIWKKAKSGSSGHYLGRTIISHAGKVREVF